MKRKPTKQKSSLRQRTTSWWRDEERYQEETLEQGIKNVDSIFVSLFRGIVAAIRRVVRSIGRGLVWPFVAIGRAAKRTGRAIKSGTRKAAKELMVVLGEIAHDVRHLVASVGRGIGKGLRWILKPFTVTFAIITRPISQRFATQARNDALSEVTMTPDHKSHWELLALLAVTVAAIAAALIATGNAASLIGIGTEVGSLARSLEPGKVVAWLGQASPISLTFVAAAGLMLALGVWFWIRMTLDAWRRAYPTHIERTRWRLITAGLFIPGALVYFFQVYNHWGMRRFVTYHATSVLVVTTAVVVATSTYGTLWYFNKQAEASVPTQASVLPKLDLDAQTRQGLLNRPQYGAPLAADSLAGRTDPFAPVPGVSTVATPSPSPSPSPSAAPNPTQ